MKVKFLVSINFYLLLCLGVYFSIHGIGFTQTIDTKIDTAGIAQNYVMEIWDNSKGLPQNAVFALEKDNLGFLWIATEEGLVRFDGLNPKVFDQDNYPEMLEQTYYTFFKTKGGIWATGDRSIALLEKNIKQVIDCSEIAEKTWIRAIAENAKGGLLIGNQKGQIYSWDAGKFSPLSYWNPQKQLEIMGFYPLDQSLLLVATTQGIYELNLETEQARLVTFENFLAFRIFGNSSYRYVYSPDAGILRIGENYELEPVLSAQESRDINPSSLTVDAENRIWAGSLEKGLILLENGNLSQLYYPELQTYTVRKIIKEKDNLYLGTLGRGLAVVRPAKVKQLSFEELKQKNIKPIYQAEDSSIWVGTKSDGLFRIQVGEIKAWTTREGLLQNGVNTIGSLGGKIYVGSTSGITVLDQASGKVVQYLTQENGLSSNYVYAIFRDSKNWLWILTRSGGIHYFDSQGKFHKIPLQEAYANTNFISILELKNKQILVGSMNQGLFRFENGKLIDHQTLPLTPGEDLIYTIYEDEVGDLWFGTHGGLVVYHQGEYKILRKRNGLKSRSVFSLISDGKEGVWITNNFGVQYFANSELEQFKYNTEKDFFIANTFYNESQGMPNSEGNGLIFPSTLRDVSERIWIPTVEGVGVIQAQEMRVAQSHPSNFIWDDLKVADQITNIEEELVIPAGVSMFQISFSLVDFENPYQYSLFYRIDPNSEQWQAIPDQRQLMFNGLKPGKYKLEVKILRHGKLEEIKTLPIRVSATLLETLAFKIFALIALGLLINFIVKYFYNIRMKRNMEAMVKLRTSELSNANVQLKEALREIEDKNKVLMDITWSQSHLVRAPLTRAMGIAQLLNQYETYPEVGKSKEELELELLEALRQLDQMVRETHAKSENIKNNEG